MKTFLLITEFAIQILITFIFVMLLPVATWWLMIVMLAR